MMKQTVLFILLFIVSIYCHAAGEVLLGNGIVPPILVFDNGNGITDTLNQLGLEYDLWGELSSPNFSSIVGAGYRVLVTGSGGNYGALATQMQAESETWKSNSGKVVLSGQNPDANYDENGIGYPNILVYNSIIWALTDHQQGTLSFISFSDSVDKWNWTPWMNGSAGSGTALASPGGSTVNVEPFMNHPINLGDPDHPYYEDPLDNYYLSDWPNSSYTSYFTALPQGFSAVALTGSGNALTIVNTNVIPIQIPEPTSILMLAFGTFLAIWLRFRKS